MTCATEWEEEGGFFLWLSYFFFFPKSDKTTYWPIGLLVLLKAKFTVSISYSCICSNNNIDLSILSQTDLPNPEWDTRARKQKTMKFVEAISHDYTVCCGKPWWLQIISNVFICQFYIYKKEMLEAFHDKSCFLIAVPPTFSKESS